MPIHYLLFEHFKSEAIIFTSGNYSDAPIIKKNDEAIKCLLPFTDIHIDNNREIINQCDDSIVQIIDNKPTIIRRSRGYVPEPYVSSLKTEGILACGAQMNSTFVIGKGNKLIQSQYIGDLSKLSVQNSYQNILTDFEKLFRFKPSKIICDLHPDYFSSLLAEKIADQFRSEERRVGKEC